ncbi:MAG: adenylate/guanylate cyclase domain-containing protein [Desulfocapsaceae bacterium]
MERRLAAILAADVVGYSRLMHMDEVGTLVAVKSCEAEIMEPAVKQYNGRIFKRMGDGLLAEFASAIDAARCALDMQLAISKRDNESPEIQQITYRIGINLGDIIIEGEDLFGDGVNIAARLEGLARPGGVCISGKVFDEVKNNIDAVFENQGEKRVKNIKKPVQVYQWVDNNSDTAPRTTIDRQTFTIPDRPSIAVLPFDNMSGDPEQEYFVDGITEDVITDLSKISGLLVISRYSSFAYKGKAVRVQQISTDLGARYLVEGSVRKIGNRIRVTAQLIEGTTGGHLWGDRYDRELTNVFVVQDEITESIVKSLQVAIAPLERVAIERIPTSDPEAYDFYLRGRNFLNEMTLKNLEHARRMFLKAVVIDPEYALAFTGIADCDSTLYMHYSSEDSVIEDALTNCKKALDLDPNLSEAHASRGFALSLAGSVEAGEKAFNKAIVIDPMLYEAYWYFGLVRAMCDDLETAVKMFRKASQVRGADLQSLMMQMTCYRGMGHEAEMHAVARRTYDIADRRLRLNPDDSRAAYIGATALVNLNERKKALDWGNLAIEIASDDPRTHYNLACLFSMLGKRQISLDHLEKSIRDGRPVGMMKWAKADPDLSSIRSEKRFHDLMELWQQLGS